MGAAAIEALFGREQAEPSARRAGFGPRKGEAGRLGEAGIDGAVRSLTRPKGEKFVGPPRDDKGRGLAPGDAWGHDHLWWLDRMVRTHACSSSGMTLGLARLVRDLACGRRLAEADAEPEQAAAPPLAWLIRRNPARDHE